jgi:hypothetical protein
MDTTLVSELCIPSHTTPIHLRLSGNHSESIQFMLIKSPQVPVVLGFFLALTAQTPYQLDCWYYGGLEPVLPCPLPEVNTTCPGTSSCVARKKPGSSVPAEYQNLQEVFSKALRFLRIDPMTAGSTFSQPLHPPGVGCIHCQVRRPMET